MKKLSAFLLIVSLIFSLCACGAPGKNENTETKTDTTEQTTENPDTGTTFTEDTTSAPAETEVNEPYAPGTVSENTYTCKYFGFGCKFGDNWEVSGHSADEKGLTETEIIYDLYAGNTDNTESVRIVVKNMGTQGTQLNEKSYFNAQLDAFKESFESTGVENISIEIAPVEFADDFHYAFCASGELNGATYEEYVVAVQRGTYFANVIFETLDGNTGELISAFYAVD